MLHLQSGARIHLAYMQRGSSEVLMICSFAFERDLHEVIMKSLSLFHLCCFYFFFFFGLQKCNLGERVEEHNNHLNPVGRKMHTSASQC